MTRYDDLRTAGRELAEVLGDRPGAVVVGIVRGGVPAAAEVAAHLKLPLDFLLLAALVQRPDGGAARAVNVAGTLVVEAHARGIAADSPEGRHVSEILERFGERERLCRDGRPPRDLAGETVILVDNGMRTGGTMRASIEALRLLRPAQIIAAVPVASPPARDLIAGLVDELVCPRVHAPFGNVAMFYRRFDVPPDERVSAFL